MKNLIETLPININKDYLLYRSGEGCEVALFKNAGFDLFLNYVDELLANSYTLINKNSIENNQFAFLKKDKISISVGYFSYKDELRIVIDTESDFPQFIPNKNVIKRTDTTFWQFEVDHSLIDCGMCYIMRLSTGSFFIIDSPHTYSINDCERIHDFLRERTPTDEKIHIAGWFFSHGHEDHIAQFISYVDFYCKDTVIDCLYFNLCPMDHRDSGDWMDSHRGYYKLFYAALERHPEIPVVRLHTGQTFYIDNLKIDVLCSHEDVYPKDNSNYNDSSVVLMLTAENTKILVPGDAGHEESYILEERYPEYLKADIVQQAHHGHFGTTDNFYRLVGASVALFPVTQIKFDEELDHWSANRVSIEIADEYHIASNGTVEIPLPYKKGQLNIHPDETFESFKGVYDLWSYEYPVEYKEKLYKEYLARGGKELEEYKNGF